MAEDLQNPGPENATLMSSLPRALVLLTFHWLEPRDLLCLSLSCQRFKTMIFPATKASTDLNNLWKAILLGTGFVPPSSVAMMKIHDVDWLASLKRLIEGVADWTSIEAGMCLLHTWRSWSILAILADGIPLFMPF